MAQSVYVFFGMIATGKSTLAQAWAEREGCCYLNSDVVRKELAGIGTTERFVTGFDEGIYSARFTGMTYDELVHRTEKALAAGDAGCVVLDASYQSVEERNRLRRAVDHKCRLLFLYCYCSEKTIMKRLELRAHDTQAVSDGRLEIYLEQKKRFAQPNELDERQLLKMNTEGPLDELLDQLRCAVKEN